MNATIAKALAADRESKSIEFKESFDPDSAGDWCEVIKDIVSIANSGGGVLVFGVDDFGAPTGGNLSKLVALDPADITNRLSKYVGGREVPLSVHTPKKMGSQIVAFHIHSVASPLVFEKPGTYSDGAKGQRTAFGQGTIYFRHGAKSDPAHNTDIERGFERHLSSVRRQWMAGVRKVVQAPLGATVEVGLPTGTVGLAPDSRSVRIVQDGNAVPIRVTRDPNAATEGTFLHEEISEALFEEINNVIDMNDMLFRGRDRFLLGSDLYYRVYAERQHVKQEKKNTLQLFLRGLTDYSPFLYWCKFLSDDVIARAFANLILRPKGIEMQTLIRITTLMGDKFYGWLEAKFNQKWSKYSQPPAFYFSLQSLGDKLKSTSDYRLLASKMGPSSIIRTNETTTLTVAQIVNESPELDRVLSHACLRVFQGEKQYRETARNLDYLAHGGSLLDRGAAIGSIVMKLVGSQLPSEHDEPQGDEVEPATK